LTGFVVGCVDGCVVAELAGGGAKTSSLIVETFARSSFPD
jgi:hypothetical protein